MEKYNVAFRYTKKAGGYHGVIFWSSYSSEAEFEERYDEEARVQYDVVEKGISKERALQLTRDTPVFCRIASCIEDAIMKDGTVNEEILSFKLSSLGMSLAMIEMSALKELL